jgi:hypothetical protein
MTTDPWETAPATSTPQSDDPWETSSPAPATAQTPEPHTTAGGLAASLSRGAAPYAAGAMTGAGIGALAGGVGAIPGAAAGAGAVGATQLITSVYNMFADKMGWSKTATPQEMTDKVLTAAGVKQPSTAIERETQAIAGATADALSGAGAAREIAKALPSGLGKGIAETLAARPGQQAVSGALSGAAAQTAAEAGAGPGVQMTAGFLGGLLPSVPGAALRTAANIGEVKQTAKNAIAAGYSIPPIEASESGRIGWLSPASLGSGESGKIKMGQFSATKNQPITNGMAAEDIGLPRSTLLNEQAFDRVRKAAGRDYGAIEQALPMMVSTPDFVRRANAIGADARSAARAYPGAIDTKKIDTVRDALLSQPFRNTSDVMAFVKEMRFQAKANLASRDDPSKLTLGLAQREAANMTEDMMSDNLRVTGNTKLFDRWQAARQLIAKTYDIESVTNVSTGDVSATALGRLLQKGQPLTGNLKLIADSANSFPRSFQNPTAFGGVEPFSVLDTLAGGAALAHGNAGLAATIVGRPVARATILSQPYQRSMAGLGGGTPAPLSIFSDPGAFNVVPPNTPGQINNEVGVR